MIFEKNSSEAVLAVLLIIIINNSYLAKTFAIFYPLIKDTENVSLSNDRIDL
jgi:hypothetical protein